MRKYKEQEEKAAAEIRCNCCGKPMALENGIIKEGICTVDCLWGYFSNKDGERYVFDLCEECYDKITKEFQIPVEKIAVNELLS